MKGSIVIFRHDRERSGHSPQWSLSQIPDRSPRKCWMLSDCLCVLVCQTGWPTLPILALKIPCHGKNLGPRQIVMVGHPIRPPVGIQFGIQKLGRDHTGQPTEGQHVCQPPGLVLWLPLGPAAPPLQPVAWEPRETLAISLAIWQGGGGWHTDRCDRSSVSHVNASAKDDLTSSKFTVGGKEPKWCW